MSAKQILGGVEIEYGFDDNLDIIVSFACPNCQALNQANLSDFGEGDEIPCSSCGVFALDVTTSDFRKFRESIVGFKGMFKGPGK